MMTLAAMDITTLIGLAREGDVVAFAELVRRHQSVVYAVALSAVSDRSLAEDAVQEAFLVAWNGLDKLEKPERAPAWLCGIARNIARKLARKGAHEIVSEPADLADAQTDDGSPLRDLLEREAGQSIEELVGGVSPRYREPIVLHYGAEQSVAEIAVCLQLSEAAVKQRLARGRGKLRERAERFAELAHACRVPATLVPAIIATLSAKTVAAHVAKGSSVIAPLTLMGVAMKKSLIIVGAALLCVASFVGYRSLRASTPEAALAREHSTGRPAQSESLTEKPRTNQRARVSGLVLDGESGEVVVGASVLAALIETGELSRDLAMSNALPETAVTDENGRFVLQLPLARYRFTANASGYVGTPSQLLNIESGGADDLELTLLAGGVRLHGSIADVGGGPIAGALVRATAAPNSIPLPTSMMTAAVSDADGRYQLWLRPGNYELGAQHLDYSTFETEIHLGKSERELDLKLVPATTVEGVVRRVSDNEPVAGAIVQVGGASRMVGISDSEGRFRFQRLSAGTVSLQARFHSAITASALSLELGIGETRSDLELWLEPGANISGRVLDDQGESVQGAAVAVLDMLTEQGFSARGQTDEAGQFVVEGIAPGTYSAVVYMDEFPVRFLRDAILVADQDVSGVKLVIQEAQSLRGRVSPAGPASVYLVRGGGETAMAAMVLSGDMSDYINMAAAQTRTTADGRFAMAGVARGAYKLIAIADEGLQGEQDVQVGGDSDVTVSMSPGWSLAGSVSTSSGQAPAGSVQLQLESIDHFPSILHVANMDARGHFEISGLGGGEYAVRVSDPHCQRELQGDVDAPPGTLKVPREGPTGRLQRDFVVSQCGRVLRGKVVDAKGHAAADAWVRVATSDATGPVTLSGADGLFELANVRSGPIKIHAYHPQLGSAQISLQEAETSAVVRLQSRPRLEVSASLDGEALQRFESKLALGAKRTSTASARDGRAIYEQVRPGTYLLEVSTEEGVGSMPVSLDWARDQTVAVPLRPWAQLQGIATTEEGTLAAGYAVTPLNKDFLSTEFSEERKQGLLLLAGSTKTDSAGRFKLERVRPDTLVLMLASPEGSYCFVPVALEAGQARDLGPVQCNRPSEGEKQ